MTSPHAQQGTQQGTVRPLDSTPRLERTPPAVHVWERRSGRWLVLRIEGEMDLQADPLVADVVGHSPFVVFELQGVTFIDASGLRVLTESQRRAAAAAGVVCLVAPSQCVRRFLALAGSIATFAVFDTVELAMSSHRPTGPDTQADGRCPSR